MMAQEKGGSCLFTTLPLERFGFAFSGKRDFRDLLRMRYRKPLDRLPTVCACGAVYSLDHSQICKLGGFIHLRHNEAERLWAHTCSKIFNDVEAEPGLEPMEGEKLRYKSAITTDEARSDVRVRGFWGNKQNAFFEMRYFYPFASSYRAKTLQTCFKSIALTRRREYEERIVRVDTGSFDANCWEACCETLGSEAKRVLLPGCFSPMQIRFCCDASSFGLLAWVAGHSTRQCAVCR